MILVLSDGSCLPAQQVFNLRFYESKIDRRGRDEPIPLGITNYCTEQFPQTQIYEWNTDDTDKTEKNNQIREDPCNLCRQCFTYNKSNDELCIRMTRMRRIKTIKFAKVCVICTIYVLLIIKVTTSCAHG